MKHVSSPWLVLLTMKMGPNNTSGVIWVLGTFFFLCFFVYYLMICILFRVYLHFEAWGGLRWEMKMKTDPNNTGHVIWVCAFFFFFFTVLMVIYTDYPYIHHQPSPHRPITCDEYGHHQSLPHIAMTMGKASRCDMSQAHANDKNRPNWCVWHHLGPRYIFFFLVFFYILSDDLYHI
jgi:hypothetical protein